uniref:Uncharacterized protein n=1 Tax=Phaeomonas parva TaxID=124430 RepID=A0A7S1XLV2_9STRA
MSSPAASSPQSFSSSPPSSLPPPRRAGPPLPLFVAIALAAAFAAVAVQGAWHLARPEAAPQPGRAANLASLADRGLAEPLQPLVSMEATKTQGRKARSPLKMPKAPPQPAPKRRRRQEKAGEAGSGEESALVMQREWEAAAEDCTDEQPIMLLDGCFMKIQAGPCAAKAIRGAQRGARNIGLAVENFVRSHKDEIKVAATAALGAVVAAATFAFEDR